MINICIAYIFIKIKASLLFLSCIKEVIVEALKTKFLLQEEEIHEKKKFNVSLHKKEIKKFSRMKSLKVKWKISKMRMLSFSSVKRSQGLSAFWRN